MVITKRNLLFTILISVTILQLSLWIFKVNENKAMDSSQDYYEELSSQNKTDTIPSLNEPSSTVPIEETQIKSVFPDNDFIYTANPASTFYAINQDYVGWIKVANTKIDYPVVRGNDNEEYLDKNFKKEKDVLGSIFMDYRNLGMGLDRHTVIYGHFTERGLMFGDLDKFADRKFAEENSVFTFSTPQGEKTYKVFSVHISPSEGPYLDTQFNNTTYGEFQNMLKESSIFDLETEPSDKLSIITLVTCNYAMEDGRLFLHAIEITN